MSRSATHRASVPVRYGLSSASPAHRKSTNTGRALAVSAASAGLVATGSLAAAPAADAGVIRVATAHRVLKPGMAGADVHRVQRQTYAPVTARYSFATVQHVKAFQRILHLPVTGTVYQRTWNALNYLIVHNGRAASGQTYRYLYVRYIKHIQAAKAAARARAAMGSFRYKVLKYAKAASGRPYVYGATGPYAFDCSGYTSYVFRKAGRSLPRTANSQKNATRPISRSAARPGDLVFFTSGGHAYHAGIYAGGRYLYHASNPSKPSGLGKIWTWSGVVFRSAI